MEIKTKKFIKSSPHLPVKNLQETINYYRDSLGFQHEWFFGDKDGGVRRDDMRLLFSEHADHVDFINNRVARLPLIWFVDNIDDIFQEFTERQVQISDPLREYPYGLREFAFVDINGYYIRVAEEIAIE